MRTKDEILIANVQINNLPDDEDSKARKRELLVLEVLLDIREELLKMNSLREESEPQPNDSEESVSEIENSFFSKNPFSGM